MAVFTFKYSRIVSKTAIHSILEKESEKHSSSTSGLTLIECLVAIVMVGLTGALIAPSLVVSFATRVNNQKIDQALQVAQSEVDRVRTTVERGTYETAELPPSTPFTQNVHWETKTLNGKSYRIEYPDKVNGPTATRTLKAESTTYSQYTDAFDARQIDVDGDNKYDFAVQTFRSPGQLDANGHPIAFSMGVRVYDIRAFSSGQTGSLSTDVATAGVVGGEGKRSSLALAVLYTTISKSDTSNSYCKYIQHLGSTPSSTYKCN